MKKSIIAILLAAIMLLSLYGCADKSGSKGKDGKGTAGADIVERILPAEICEDLTQEDLEYDLEQGMYTDAKLLDDGTVKLTMTKDQYNNLINEMTTVYEDSIAEMSGEESIGIAGIDKNLSFTEFSVYTISEELGFDRDMFAENLIYMGKVYNAYTGNADTEIKVEFIHKESGKLLATYPEK